MSRQDQSFNTLQMLGGILNYIEADLHNFLKN